VAEDDEGAWRGGDGPDAGAQRHQEAAK